MQLSFVEGRNRMKLCNKISKGVAKGAEVICMLTIAALVLVIVVELLRRNFLGQSFGGNVQLCIDTGFGRYGLPWDDPQKVWETARSLERLRLTGT